MLLENDEIAVAVFTSALNLRERALSVQNTWLQNFNKGYLIGGRHLDAGLKLISVGPDVDEDYSSAHKKQFLGLIELYHRFPEVKWYFITGCDAYIYAENLVELLSGFDPDKELLVGGHCGAVIIEGEQLVYPAGGPGFALSNALVANLQSVIPTFIDEWVVKQPKLGSACDVALAYLAKRERHVSVTFREGFYYGPPYYYPDNTYKDGAGIDVNHEVIDKPIAFHNLSIREMYILEGGTYPKRAGFWGKLYDKISIIITRKMGSRTLINRISRLLFLKGEKRKARLSRTCTPGAHYE